MLYEGDMYNMGAAATTPAATTPAATTPAATTPAATTPAATSPAGAVAPYDLSALAGLDLSGLYGMNFGSNFGGGAMGGIYPDDPNTEFIAAPLSNKGNATSQTGGNAFEVRVDQPVRLVDLRTNQVVFEGTGYDAARQAVATGQNLSDTLGRKAQYVIQTADPTGNYSTVAYEKANKSTLGEIANVAGTLLPLAMIPLTAGASAGSLLASTAGKIGLGTALGAAGAGLKGDNILKGAVMGGLSSAGGALLGGPIGDIGASNIGLRAGTAIGTGIGSTAGGLVTGQNLKNSLLGGVASGALSYISPDITKALSGGAPASSSTSGSAPSGGDIVVSATPAVTPISLNTSLGGSPNKIQQALAETPYDGLTVSGNRVGSTFSVNTGSDRFGTPGKGEVSLKELDPKDIVVDATKTTSVSAPSTGAGGGEITPEYLPKEEIVVDATKRTVPVSTPVTGPLTTTAPAVLPKEDIVVDATKRTVPVSAPVTGPLTTTAPAVLPKEDIVVDATTKTTPVSSGFTLSSDTLSDIDKLSEAERKAKEEEAKKKLGVEEYLRLAALAAGLLGGGKDGSGSSGTYIPGGTGNGRLNPIFSAQLPATGGLGTVGTTRTARPLGDQDWLTYGTRPELKFFDYSATPANPAPVTSPVPGNPAGPIMQQRDPTAMAEGGALAAKRGGQSRRTEFAVNGPGTGRSDEIPAVLSDGEYVIDAETVALLGDGSSKAGAKKLDELRVKVRKHKGKKLAKGRFSANAKKPEAYLSGGRI
jgi:hypothetical protein